MHSKKSNGQHNILILHGALGCADDMLMMRGLLEQKGHRTFSFDFRGHGQSTQQWMHNTLEELVEDLHFFLQQQDVTIDSILGHSMGAYVALMHQKKYSPATIKKIVGYGTKFDWSLEATEKECAKLPPEVLRVKAPVFCQSLANKHGEKWDKLLDKTAAMMRWLSQGHKLNSCDFQQIVIPVTLLWGDQDRMTTWEETLETTKAIPQGQAYIIAESRHEWERADLVAIAQHLT